MDDDNCSLASASALRRSNSNACAKPSRVGFSFFAGVVVLLALRELPLRADRLPKGPVSIGSLDFLF